MMRRSLQENKNFLKKVHKSSSVKALEKAENSELKTLGYAVHLVLNRKVPLNKKIIKYCTDINRKKINALKKIFANKENFKNLSKLSKSEQLKIFRRYINIIKVLLSSFFSPEKAIKPN